MEIRVSDLSVHLPDGKLLFRLKPWSITPGTRMLIEGPSGKGKTTLLHLLAGLFPPTEGYVFWGEKNIKLLREAERCRERRRSFGIVFQNLNLLDHLTALENVLLGVRGRADALTQATQALADLSMIDFAHKSSGHLSLGEQQRIAVARVVAAAPKIILADEPTSGLDDANAEAVMNGLLGLPNNPTILVVSHDARLRSKFKEVRSMGDLIQ
jgi:putative ABC transport system ATP-binding protein